jgi:hypothetical protein
MISAEIGGSISCAELSLLPATKWLDSATKEIAQHHIAAGSAVQQHAVAAVPGDVVAGAGSCAADGVVGAGNIDTVAGIGAGSIDAIEANEVALNQESGCR